MNTMVIALSSLVPNVEDLLALPFEDVAPALLVHLNSYPDGGVLPIAKASRSTQQCPIVIP